MDLPEETPLSNVHMESADNVKHDKSEQFEARHSARKNPISILDDEEESAPTKKRRIKTVARKRALPLRSELKESVEELRKIVDETKTTTEEACVDKPDIELDDFSSDSPVYVAEGSSKTVLEELQICEKFFKKQRLGEVLELIKLQGWDKLFKNEDSVDKELVSEFYSEVSKEEKGAFVYLNFVFKGQELTVSSKELAYELGLKHEGFDIFSKGKWPEQITEEQRKEMQERVCGYYDPNTAELPTTNMTPTVKILHRLLVSTFLPRGSKTSSSQIHDILILDYLLRKQPINLPKLILHNMEYISQFGQVGHARIIKRILKMHNLYTPKTEVSVIKPITLNSLHRWGLQYEEGVGWSRRAKASDDAKEKQKVGEAHNPTEKLDLMLKEVSEFRDEVKEMFSSLRADMDRELSEVKKEVEKISTDYWMIEEELKAIKNLVASGFTKFGKQ